ncbi:MAG: hypothetical protein WCJ56_03530 [bacterium]
MKIKHQLYCISYLLLFLVLGCSNSTGPTVTPANLTTAPITGHVIIPGGAIRNGVTLMVQNSLGAVNPGTDGAFSLISYSAGRQFAFVTDANDALMLAGFINAEHPDLSVHSTAVALVYIQTMGFTLSTELQANALDLLEHDVALNELESTITTQMASDPLALEHGNTAIAAALKAVCASIITEDKSRGVLITPAESRSAITIDTSQGLNEFRVTNAARRRNYVYIDRVSYVPNGGNASVAAPANITAFDGPMPSGVGGTVNSYVDLIRGKIAYAPQSSNSVYLPLYPDDAESTRYKVTVVGFGISDGDLAELTAEQKAKMGEMATRSLVLDYLLPIALNTLLPLNKEAIDAAVMKDAAGTYKDMLSILSKTLPGVIKKSENGDIEGAIADSVQALTTNGTFRNAIVALLAESEAHLTSVAKGKQVAESGKAVGKLLMVTDIILTSTDTIIQTWHLAGTNKANNWTLDVTQPRVSLSPKETTIKPFEKVLLEVKYPDGKPTGALNFFFSNTGSVGNIFNSEHENGPNSFDTTKDWVWYLAEKGDPGEDTVSLEAYLTVNGKKKLLAKTTAHITVVGTTVALDPAVVTLKPGESQRFTAKINPPPAAGTTLSYKWSCPGGVGTLADAAASPVRGKSRQRVAQTFENSSPTSTYTAGNSEGEDLISLDVFTGSGSEKPKIGSTTATVTITRSSIEITPREATIASGKTRDFTAVITPTPPEGTVLEYLWTNTATVGTIDGQRSRQQTVGTTSPSVKYQASQVAVGDDTIRVEVKKVIGSQRISLGTASATAHVVKYIIDLSPDKTLNSGASYVMTVGVTPTPTSGTLMYQWQNTHNFGRLVSGSQTDTIYGTSATATYTADAIKEGNDTITLSAYWDDENRHIFLGTVTRTITVRRQRITGAARPSLVEMTYLSYDGQSTRAAFGGVVCVWPKPDDYSGNGYTLVIHMNGHPLPFNDPVLKDNAAIKVGGAGGYPLWQISNDTGTHPEYMRQTLKPGEHAFIIYLNQREDLAYPGTPYSELLAQVQAYVDEWTGYTEHWTFDVYPKP